MGEEATSGASVLWIARRRVWQVCALGSTAVLAARVWV